MGIIAKKGWEYRGVPKELILKLKEDLGFEVFIETGTYMGETSIWASNFFSKVVTIEASKEIFERLNLKKYENIKSVFGDSKHVLNDIITSASIFYLDAHNSGGETHNSYPLLEELDAINKSKFEHVIIVDDARFCMSQYNSECYGEITDICSKLGFNNRYVIIFEDMLIAVPRVCKNIIDDYTNEKSKKQFDRFLYEDKFKILRRLIKR